MYYTNCTEVCQYCLIKNCSKRKCPPKTMLVSEDTPYIPLEKDERKNIEYINNTYKNLLFS